MAKVGFIMARPNVAAALAFRGTAFQARSCGGRSRGAAVGFLLPVLGGSTTKLKYCPSSSYPHIVPIIPLGLGGGSITMSEGSQHQRHLSSSVRATNVNDSGSIDSPLIKTMENKIKEHLNAESVSVKDAYGDGRHVSIDVISSAFEGESAVSRQRMVYRAIWEELQSVVHAVDQMTTKTPSEVAAAAADK